MDALRTEAKGLFPTIYLTLVSLVQALALEKLLSAVFAPETDLGSGVVFATRAAQFVTIFFGLVVVWHDYVLGVIRYRYVVGIQDTLIPFGMAFVEFGVVEATRRGDLANWFLWQGVTLALGVYIYVHQYRQARREPENGDVAARWGGFTLRQRVAALGGGAVASLALALWLPARPSGSWLEAFFVVGAAALVIGYIARTAHAWSRLVEAASSDL